MLKEVDTEQKHQAPIMNEAVGTKKVGLLQELEIKKRFPDNVEFRVENFIQDLKVNKKFDTIMCFSVTKWVHLNWGDTGVRRLFKKVYDSLNDGGIFILEPQEWKSYKKKKHLTEQLKENFKKIELKPGQF